MKNALVNVRILDGHENMAPLEGYAILIEEEKITAVVPEAEVPEDCQKTDLGGKYLLPGLINMHVHIPASGKPSKKKMNYARVAALLRYAPARAAVRAMCAKNAKQQLLSGTTTVRAVGGVLDFDTDLRDKINAGKKTGPRILAANCAVSVPGGHMTGSVALPAHSPGEAAQMVRDRVKEHPDLIKLMITGGVLDAKTVGEPGDLKMPPEYVKAATDEAHKNGLKVAAHVEGPEGLRIALECGVDTIEHGGKVTDEIMELFRNSGSVLIATLSPAVPFCFIDRTVTGMSETDLINGKAMFDYMVGCIARCRECGIPVGLGTDTGCPYITQYDMWRELYYFCRFCHVSPAFAIHTATEINAKLAGISGITGTVEAGKSADFMVVEKNPLEDITALRNPTDVFFRGRRIRNPKPKRFPEADTQLDRILSIP